MIGMHFERLQVWQRSMHLAEELYAIVRSFPPLELYGLSSQIRRAAVSVPSNIAEGSQRTSAKEFAHFLLIARGSLAEIQTQCLLAKRLRYIAPDDAQKFYGESEEISKMLYALHKKLTSSSKSRI